MQAAIYGVKAEKLSAQEVSFFRAVQPFGFILFARNLKSKTGILRLTTALRDCVDHVPVIFVDQEGGRVQRLTPRLCRSWPAASFYGDLYQKNPDRACEAVALGHRLMAFELKKLGINGNCVPLLDLPRPGADPIISDRVFSANPEQAIRMAKACMAACLAQGLMPVVKHLPGHGRAQVDSHLELPIVDTPLAELRATDFEIFRHFADAPLGMTAHIVYSSVDEDQPSTHSVKVIEEIIRGYIGFEGLLMSDDISMQALTGTISECCNRAYQAGCDMVLHCNGDFEEMQQVAANAPNFHSSQLQRVQAVLESVEKKPKYEAFETMLANWLELTGQNSLV